MHPPSQDFSDPFPPSLPPFSSRCYGAESGLGPSPHLSSLELLSPKALRSLPCHPCTALSANPGAWAELGGHGSWVGCGGDMGWDGTEIEMEGHELGPGDMDLDGGTQVWMKDMS